MRATEAAALGGSKTPGGWGGPGPGGAHRQAHLNRQGHGQEPRVLPRPPLLLLLHGLHLQLQLALGQRGGLGRGCLLIAVAAALQDIAGPQLLYQALLLQPAQHTPVASPRDPSFQGSQSNPYSAPKADK